jgi:hypothetical protein
VKRGLTLLLVTMGLFVYRAAWAQRVQVDASVDATTVAIGDVVTYTMKATSMGGGTPSGAQPGATPGFAVERSMSAPTQMALDINGVASTISSLTTTWTLRAQKTGTFSLGPPSVTVDGRRIAARSVRVRVVPQGQAPPRPAPKPRPNPFDPFAGTPFDPFQGFFDDFEPPRRVPQPTGDPRLSLDTPRAPIAFLHARVDRTRVVVGEQVTLSMYLYSLPEARLGKARDIRVPTATDFVRRPLMTEGKEIPLGRVMVGERLWDVELISKDALFPLKAGRLQIGAMSMSLPDAHVGHRESETLHVEVTEPPLAGRPPGYQLGDVGDFSLQASTTPQKVSQGGSIGVTVELRGAGNLPSKLPLPEIPGVEWLDAQQRETLGVMQSDRYGGSRTFSYVARLQRPGSLDLGEARLPYFNPVTRTYQVARASLGIVEVTPGDVRDAGGGADEPALPGLPPPRAELEGVHETTFVTGLWPFWAAVLGSPLACVLGLFAASAARRVREKRASATPSPDRIARERVREAESAAKGDDGRAATSAAARALEAGVLARTGVNLRGAPGEAAASELEAASVSPSQAREIVSVLRACEDARFSPQGVSIGEARALWSRASAALEGLGGKRK